MTPQIFKTRFPEFTNIDDSRIELFINDASIMVTEAKFGSNYETPQSYLTAHYLSLSQKTDSGSSGSVGQVASKSVEGVSVSYNTPTAENATNSYYASTSYGLRYLEFLSQVTVGNIMTV